MLTQKDILKDFVPYIDLKYKTFHSRLVNNINPERILGVRIPIVRQIATQKVKDGSYVDILKSPNKHYIEELELYGMIVNKLGLSFDDTLNYVNKMLPYVDNWAVCDTMQFDVFKKYTKQLLPYVLKWLKDKEIYTQRFGIVCLIKYFSNEHFNEQILNYSLLPQSDNYYIEMARAWFYSVVVCYHYDSIINLLKSDKLSTNVQNFTIKKCCESLRLNPKQKAFLRTFKRK